VTAHVHRDGPHQITVEDDNGNRARFVTTCCALEIEQQTYTSPRLSPADALALAAELDQWATTQLTRPLRR
jgi:hypothetical protein